MKERESFHVACLLYRPAEMPYPAVMAWHLLTRMLKRAQRFISFWLSCVDLSEDLTVPESRKERGSHSFKYAGLERIVLTSKRSHTRCCCTVFPFLCYFGNSCTDKNVNTYNQNHNNSGWGGAKKWLTCTEWSAIERWSIWERGTTFQT